MSNHHSGAAAPVGTAGTSGLTGTELTDPRASRVKAIGRLAKRTFRERERRFVAEGPQAVREALALPGVVQELYLTRPAFERHADLVSAATEGRVPVRLVSGQVCDALAATVTPQGVLAVCGFVDVSLDELIDQPIDERVDDGHHAPDRRPRLLAVLAQVRDPGNAGTVIRCADAAGARGVVMTDASVDVYNPKCVRASAGSLFHLPTAVGVPAEEAVARIRDAGLTVLAADGSGETDIAEAGADGLLSKPTAWIFGNEAWGLRPEIRALADVVVRVPIYGRAESLNLATAAAVCLYASATAQRSPHHSTPRE